MSKILNINDDIKINKNNVQTPYTMLLKASGSESTIVFTANPNPDTGYLETGCVPIWIDQNCRPYLIIVSIHSSKIQLATVIGGDNITTSISEDRLTLTLTTGQWSFAVLTDFRGNAWS